MTQNNQTLLIDDLQPIDNCCPYCKKSMLLFRSFFKKVCVDCGRSFEWNLKVNQVPLIQHQR